MTLYSSVEIQLVGSNRYDDCLRELNDESQCYTIRPKDKIANTYGDAVSFAQPSAHEMEYVYNSDLQTKEVLESLYDFNRSRTPPPLFDTTVDFILSAEDFREPSYKDLLWLLLFQQAQEEMFSYDKHVVRTVPGEYLFCIKYVCKKVK